MPNMRYGIFGGAFDPIHLGHLLLAESALRQARLDRVIFVPTGHSPHTNGKPDSRASKEDRYEMLETAIAGCDEFLASRYELDREEPSYTVDTLRYFKTTFSLIEPDLFLLLGADAFNDLPNWKNVTEICRLAIPLAVSRPDWPEPYYQALSGIVSMERLHEIRATTVVMPQIQISSTRIRNAVAEGKSIRFQVPRSVETHIAAHHLYQAPN